MDNRGQMASSLPFVLFLMAFFAFSVYFLVNIEASSFIGNYSMSPDVLSCTYDFFGIISCGFKYLGLFVGMIFIDTASGILNLLVFGVFGLAMAWALFEQIAQMLKFTALLP